jgi:hypothetical protein
VPREKLLLVLPRYCRSHGTGQRLGVAAPFSSQNVIAALGSHRRRKESRYERNRRQQSEPSPEQGCNLQSSGVALAKPLHEKDNPDKLVYSMRPTKSRMRVQQRLP